MTALQCNCDSSSKRRSSWRQLVLIAIHIDPAAQLLVIDNLLVGVVGQVDLIGVPDQFAKYSTQPTAGLLGFRVYVVALVVLAVGRLLLLRVAGGRFFIVVVVAAALGSAVLCGRWLHR